MTDEFEDRESELDQDIPEGLGDLPQDKAFARGEPGSDFAEPDFIPPGTLIQGRRGAGIPKDIAREARISERPGTIGSVVVPYGVTSVYNGRHINARDFMVTQKVSMPVSLEVANLVTSASVTVPGGYVGVWRNFSVVPAILPSPAISGLEDGSDFGNVQYTLTVNDTVVPEYEDMQLEHAVNQFELETWVLGLQNQRFSVVIRWTSVTDAIACVGNGGNIFFFVTFYGQNLLTRGLPLPFQIATQDQGGSTRRD